MKEQAHDGKTFTGIAVPDGWHEIEFKTVLIICRVKVEKVSTKTTRDLKHGRSR